MALSLIKGLFGKKKEKPSAAEKKAAQKPKKKFQNKNVKPKETEAWRPGGKPVDKKVVESGQDNEKGRQPRKNPRRRKPQSGPKNDGTAPQQQKPPRQERPRQRKPREEQPRQPKKDLHQGWTPDQYPVEVQEGKTRFADLNLPDRILHALADMKFQYCTPIQEQILPHTLKGKDAFGKAQTGTGKTAAFLIQIFTKFLNEPLDEEKRRRGMPRALILAPTRELAIQIAKDAEQIAKYTDIRTVAVYGGMDYAKQQRYLDDYVDLVVATPGRLIDFSRNKVVDLRNVEVLVIDEADRMLDMGFIPDVKRIVFSTPHKERRHTLLFSATLDEPVMRLANSWMVDPVRIEIEPDQVATDTVDQKVYIVTDDQKFQILYNLLDGGNARQSIIFTNRRDQAEALSERLRRYGIECEMLSGAVSQKARLRILENFKSGKVKYVVATDVAGRGIHVDDITHVVNFNIPQNPEDYVHRIGRTGRAGATGTSITFACEMESFELPAIEELLGEPLKCEQAPEELLKELPEPKYAERPRPKRSGDSSRPRSGGNRGGGQRRGGNRSGGGGRPRGGQPRRSSGR